MGSDKRERQKQGRQARLEAARAAQQRARRLRTLRNAAILIVIGVAVFWAYVQFTDDDEEPVATDDTATSTTISGSSTTAVPGPFTYGTGPCPAEDGASPRTITFADAPQQCIDPAQQYTAVFETTEGTVRVALDTTTTPGTANNFAVLSRYHFYDGTAIFRTDPSIGIIQGGAPSNSASDPGPGYDLPDEGFDFASLPGAAQGQPSGGPYSYAAGDLVMARSGQPNGAGAQFFFCVTADCAALDSQGVYVKFGTVTEGLDVLEAILALHQEDTTGQVLGGAPSRPVTIESVTIEGAPAS